MKPVHTLLPYFPKIHSDIILTVRMLKWDKTVWRGANENEQMEESNRRFKL